MIDVVRRTLFVFLVFVQTAAGVWGMIWVLPYHGTQWLEIAILATFAPLYAFIAAGSWMAIIGFLVRRLYGRRGDRHGLMRRHADRWPTAPFARTALVMPIYHEDVSRVYQGLRATWLSLMETGESEWFELFLLSDSRDPEIWLAEQAAWRSLVAEFGLEGRFHYRRRRVNLKAKTGNVGDFLRRWGRDFRYFIVLDADSVMSGKALTTLVRLMECDPRIGMIQTVPRLFNARSAFARMQQFVTHLYGPLFTEGLAALQRSEAVFWGHNAIIRTEPFIRHCGLPRMRGIGLWRGAVLSHDFLEAALMVRAGYQVWLEPRIAGSFEESPPSLDDELIRDRRWSKGNLQHLRYLLAETRLRLAHRFALFNGIFAYVASPVWFLFLVLTTVEVARFKLGEIDYFPNAEALYPVWPQWHPEWAVWLVTSTLVTLFLPKVLALVDVLVFDPVRRRGFGSRRRLLQGFFLENLVSVLLAPIRMLAHSLYVVTALVNVSVHWAGQNRSSELTWGMAWARHAPGALLALTWSGIAYLIDPYFFFWTLPISISLLLAAPVTVWLSRFTLGQRWRQKGLWLTPPETGRDDAVLKCFDPMAQPPGPAGEHSWLVWTLLDPRQWQRAAARAPRRGGRAREAAWRVAEEWIEKGPDGLPGRRAERVLDDVGAMRRVHEHAWTSGATTPWGRRVERYARHVCAGAGAAPDWITDEPSSDEGSKP
ncbi:MAG: glucans biosynthesis glucosyltransferase MdoH [Halothiobacillaceae bacterium]|nr:glucans biosynthesis glucosyltransferase MdoH [Halothiobacillaceae bacterium]